MLFLSRRRSERGTRRKDLQ